jgi:hypothetical protein
VAVHDGPAAHRTAVSLSNVSLGHATALRILALLTPPPAAPADDAAPAPPEPLPEAGPPPRRSSTAVDVHDCRLVWKYQQAAAQQCAVPAALHDFLSLHEDVASLELPYLHLALPLDPGADPAGPGPAAPPPPAAQGGSPAASPRPSSADDVVVVRDAALHMATLGFLGRPSLPVAQLPQLAVTRAPGGGGRLRIAAASLDFGMHPSHLGTAAAAVQLYRHELELLTREPPDASTGARRGPCVVRC